MCVSVSVSGSESEEGQSSGHVQLLLRGLFLSSVAHFRFDTACIGEGLGD